MNSTNFAAIIVAVISIISAALAGRSARKAAEYNSDASVENARVIAETEAYNRARKMDIETIERQDAEIDEVREQNKKLRAKVRELQNDNEALHEANRILKLRVSRLERYQEENRE
jgi:FtsZ-binding cell division protein ZapB